MLRVTVILVGFFYFLFLFFLEFSAWFVVYLYLDSVVNFENLNYILNIDILV